MLFLNSSTELETFSSSAEEEAILEKLLSDYSTDSFDYTPDASQNPSVPMARALGRATTHHRPDSILLGLIHRALQRHPQEDWKLISHGVELYWEQFYDSLCQAAGHKYASVIRATESSYALRLVAKGSKAGDLRFEVKLEHDFPPLFFLFSGASTGERQLRDDLREAFADWERRKRISRDISLYYGL